MLPIVLAAYAAFQVASGYQQGEMIREQGKIKKKIDDMNAEFAEADAWRSEREGDTNVAMYQEQVDQSIADQRAAYASQGVDVSFGTAAEVVEENKLTGMLNIIDIQRAAREKARGFRNEARNRRLSGNMAIVQSQYDASSRESQGWTQAANTAVSGYARR